MSGAIPPLFLYSFMVWTGETHQHSCEAQYWNKWFNVSGYWGNSQNITLYGQNG